MAKYQSESKKITPNAGLRTSRYRYLALEDAEPNLGFVTEKQLPLKSQYYQLVSFDGGTVYDRYWQVAPAGIVTGISIFDEGFLVGVGNSVNKINFVGAAVSATASGTISTITIFAPGNNKELIFNNGGEFGSSSNLTFDNTTGTFQINKILNVGLGGTIITNTLSGLVGIGTTNPTQNLHLNGNLRITGTVYDYYNQSGVTGQLLIKNALGGLEWINQGSIQAGAGGTYTNIQYQNYSGLLGGATNFVYDPFTSRVGIGSTQPNNLLDVLGYSRFTGQTDIDNLRVTGIATIANLGVTGLTTTQNLNVLGIATASTLGVSGILTARNLQVVGVTTLANLGVTGLTTTQNLNVLGIATASTLGVSGLLTTRNLQVVGITTVGFVTGTDAYFTGIVTATKFVGEIQSSLSNFVNINVTGIATINTLGVSGLTTTRNLQVIGVSTLGIATAASITTPNLVVSGISTLSGARIDNVYIGIVDDNTISTPIGNLILDSFSGTTQINDILYVNDSTTSTNSQSGALVVNGGAGINQNLNVKGYASIGSTFGVTGSSFLTTLNTTGVTTLASAGGITTTGGDLYVNGNLFVKNDIFYDELFARNGLFTGIVTTKDLNVTGIATIANLGVTASATFNQNVSIAGILTVTDQIDANGGATIDNIRLGIANDNTIDTSVGNLTLNAAGGTVNVSSQLAVTGVTTFNSNVILGDANTDLVTFNSRINSNVVPSTNIIYDLGTASLKWNNVYANTFNGTFVGTANKADALSTARTISVTGDLIYVSGAFDGTANVTGVGTLSNTGVVAGTYGSSTQVGIITVDAKGRITSASNQNIGFSSATVQNSDNLKTVTRSVNATHYLTFVDSDNNPAAYEAFYTDPDITYNPSSNVLSLSNLFVSGISTFAGNVDLGNDITDLINITGRVNTSIIPSSNGSYDLGSTSFKWNNIYANTFVGTITGNADSATQLANSRNFSISGDVSAPSVAFNGTANVDLVSTLSNSGVSSGTYGSSTTVPVIAVDSKGRITSASNQGINFSAATVAQADKLTNARNIAITGDLSWSVNFDGSSNVTSTGTLANSGVTSATYGSSIQIPQISVDSKGRITSATNVSISAGTLTGVIVTQTNYGCSNPISTSITGGVTTIGIGTTSNAYGTRYVQSTAPSSPCDGDIWYDTSSSSPTVSDVPTGSVFYFAASSAPTGYLSCNGANISRTTYSELFAIISTTYGAGDGSTTFTLPDLRGEFIRGWDDGRGVDASRSFGSFQAQNVQPHTHDFRNFYFAENNGNSGLPNIYAGSNVGNDNDNNPFYIDWTTSNNSGTETRPRNIALLPCIKY